ncbi:hypothetical protein PVK06_002966 [Gossypium arboreum]|uniref:Uncharacterized protein n=1 Tax=Gossypium arboreum TaxID=29729 RepID=A0ABR0R542_GOSAR|nr:hypothetical protein PVK06_002966 [Gossypium arboreum]
MILCQREPKTAHSLIRNGCMNNLYNSVEVLNAWYLRTEAGKTMLLDSQNRAAAQFKNLKLAMDDNAV